MCAKANYRMRNVLFPVVPVPQGSMSVFRGRIVHSKSKELNAYRKLINDVASQHFREPLAGGVRVDLRFIIPRPKTVIRDRPSVKPDLDKLIRAVLDGLTGVAYFDDAQVTAVQATKRYGDGLIKQGVWITVQTDDWIPDELPNVRK